MTYRELAAALGVNPGTALKWHRRGMPLDVEGAKAWRAEHARLRVKTKPTAGAVAAPDDDNTFTHWRTRREKALALQAERELARQARQLYRASEVHDEWGRVLTTVKQRLLSIPDRVAPQIPMEHSYIVHAALRREIHDTLTELSRHDGAPPKENEDE